MLGLAAALTVACNAHADSFASSASSAGSASSGSVSDSLSGSSNSSKTDKRVDNGPYRIIDIAATPGHAGMTRLTMQAEAAQQPLVLDLPQATFDQQQLAQGEWCMRKTAPTASNFPATTRAPPSSWCWPTSGTANSVRVRSACEAMRRFLAPALLLLPPARPMPAARFQVDTSSRFCDRSQELSAAEQDKLLRFAAVVREELAATEGSVALISRSGLDLSRFGIRYSHAALAWRHEQRRRLVRAPAVLRLRRRPPAHF